MGPSVGEVDVELRGLISSQYVGGMMAVSRIGELGDKTLLCGFAMGKQWHEVEWMRRASNLLHSLIKRPLP